MMPTRWVHPVLCCAAGPRRPRRLPGRGLRWGRGQRPRARAEEAAAQYVAAFPVDIGWDTPGRVRLDASRLTSRRRRRHNTAERGAVCCRRWAASFGGGERGRLHIARFSSPVLCWPSVLTLGKGGRRRLARFCGRQRCFVGCRHPASFYTFYNSTVERTCTSAWRPFYVLARQVVWQRRRCVRRQWRTLVRCGQSRRRLALSGSKRIAVVRCCWSNIMYIMLARSQWQRWS